MPTDGAGLPLTANRIQFVDEVMDWQTAIRRVGAPLVAEDAVTPEYVETAIGDALERGPYFDLGQQIAMPHARPEAGAKAIALSFLRCGKPVLLLDAPDHPIEVFIMLSAIDNSSHLSVIAGLVKVLTDPVKVRQLKGATSADDVLDTFGVVH